MPINAAEDAAATINEVTIKANIFLLKRYKANSLNCKMTGRWLVSSGDRQDCGGQLTL